MLQISILKESLTVCRLNPTDTVPDWATAGRFFNITRTFDELSIVCEERLAPPGVQMEGGWRGLKVEGPLDFALTGILSGLSTALAQAGISLFAISTYDTDYILIKGEDLRKAMETLNQAGYSVKSQGILPT